MLSKYEKLTLTVAVASIAVSIIIWQFPKAGASNVSSESIAVVSPFIDRVAPEATLIISGTGAKVEIKKTAAGIRYNGGEVSETAANSVVYLQIGQPLVINLSGTGAQASIDSELMPYITINNSSTGGKIIER